MREGRIREALPAAERAVAGARRCLADHALLASILLQLGRAADADAVISQAANLEPGAADAYDGLAYVSLALNRHERANTLYRRATELAPRTARYWYNLACSERSFGRLDAAELACDRAIGLDPGQHQTWLLRSELKVQTPEANHIEALAGALGRAGSDDPARVFLGYALAKELDDMNRFDDAFVQFAAAAKIRRAQMTYDVAVDERTLRRIREVFPGQGSERPPAVADARCIFVVGLPRSGTTLVERILGGLNGVRSNGETENFARAMSAASHGDGDIFERAVAADPTGVAAHYRRLAGLDASTEWVIEKLPTNFLYLGAIHRALPGAKIVLVQRCPLDSCFAMFRTLFGQAYPFTYDVEDLARYYAAYAALMKHWRAVLGETLHEVSYENLVREPSVTGAAVAAYCGVEWSPAALDIQQNKSVSLTASAAQVRRPVYGSSSGRWRHYRRQLAPLIAALRRHGVALPEDAPG